MRTISLMVSSLASAAAVAATGPNAVTMTQDPVTREVTIAYTMPESVTCVPTLSVETNGPAGWCPLDAAAYARVTGDVNRKVTLAAGTIRWNPEGIAVDPARMRARVTTWPMDDTPDYMVYSLAANTPADDRVRYYASEAALPGGILSNLEYRTLSMVFRKVRAKGVTWKMGSNHDVEPAGKGYENEGQFEAALDHNYYLAVFPLTQSQYRNIMGSKNSNWFPLEPDLRIQDALFYSINQCARGSNWPADPADTSILGKMRALSGNAVDFDLPSEAEWEFACRCGYGDNHYGNGERMSMTYAARLTDPVLDRLARYRNTNGSAWNPNWQWQVAQSDGQYQGPENGTPIAGSYEPNAWGFYDMLGGASEWCLDWYQDDISGLKGRLNIDKTDGSKLADGVTAGAKRVVRGGSYHDVAFVCRPAYRAAQSPGYRGDWCETTIRVKCTMGLR